MSFCSLGLLAFVLWGVRLLIGGLAACRYQENDGVVYKL